MALARRKLPPPARFQIAPAASTDALIEFLQQTALVKRDSNHHSIVCRGTRARRTPVGALAAQFARQVAIATITFRQVHADQQCIASFLGARALCRADGTITGLDGVLKTRIAVERMTDLVLTILHQIASASILVECVHE